MQTNKTKPHHNFFIPDNVSVLCFSSYATLLFLVAPILLHTYKPQQYRSFPKYENRNKEQKRSQKETRAFLRRFLSCNTCDDDKIGQYSFYFSKSYIDCKKMHLYHNL